jgi:hypothetical protein
LSSPDCGSSVAATAPIVRSVSSGARAGATLSVDSRLTRPIGPDLGDASECPDPARRLEASLYGVIFSPSSAFPTVFVPDRPSVLGVETSI